MRPTIQRAGCLLLTLVAVSSLPAAQTASPKWRADLDPAATQVSFVLDATLHKVDGTARLTSGRIETTESAGSAPAGGVLVGGRIVIDAKSLETGIKRRDRRMHTEVLESERYPEIVFLPQRMEGALSRNGRSLVKLGGTIEIHGSRHPLEANTVVDAKDGTFTAQVQFSIPYVQWGMKDVSSFLLRVGKEVDVTIRAAGKLSP